MSKFRNQNRFWLTRLVIFLIFLVVLPAWAGSKREHEIWISPQINGLGTHEKKGRGTLEKPYYGDFDYILNQQPPDTVVHLLPGVFFTAGCQGAPEDLRLKRNMKLIGAGIDVTIIRRDKSIHHESWGEVLLVCDRNAPGVEVSDMTLDVAGTDESVYQNSGITFSADNCAVRRVKVINPNGNGPAGRECFAIFMGDVGTTNDLVENCEVSSMRRDYNEGISVAGQTLVCSNKVVLNGGANGLQASGSKNAVLRNNYVVGAGNNSGFYTDTYGETNLTIASNVFENVQSGIFFNKIEQHGWGIEGLKIIGNTVLVSPTHPGGGVGINSKDKTGTELFENIVVEGNVVEYYGGEPSHPGTPGGVMLHDVSGRDLLNIKIVNNKMDRRFAIVSTGAGNWYKNNRDLSGNLLDVTNISESLQYCYLSQVDRLVTISAEGCGDVVLPNAWGFKGKEIIVSNQKHGGPIIIAAPAANQCMVPEGWPGSVSPANELLPSGPVTLAPGQSGLFVSDGNTHWTRQ